MCFLALQTYGRGVGKRIIRYDNYMLLLCMYGWLYVCISF